MEPKEICRAIEGVDVASCMNPEAGLLPIDLVGEPQILEEIQQIIVRGQHAMVEALEVHTSAFEGPAESPQLAGSLEQCDSRAGPAQVVGRGETRDPTADDSDVSELLCCLTGLPALGAG
jgi:hypothetical protein